MIPVKPGPKKILKVLGTKDFYPYYDDYSGDFTLIPDGIGFVDDEKCRMEAELFIDTEKVGAFENKMYEYGVEMDEFTVEEEIYPALERRQKTSLGAEGSKWRYDKGVPLFDDEGKPLFYDWEFINISGIGRMPYDTRSIDDSIDAIKDAINEEKKATEDSGKKSRVIVEYKVKPVMLKKKGYICKVYRKKIKEFPSHYVDASLDFVQNFHALPAVDPFEISKTPLRVRITGINKKKDEESIRDHIVSYIDDEGKVARKEIKVPVFEERDLTLAPSDAKVDEKDVNVTRLRDELIFLGFKEKAAMYEYDNYPSFYKIIDYEEKSDIDEPLSCNVNVRQKPAYILPYEEKSTSIPGRKKIDVALDASKGSDIYWNVEAFFRTAGVREMYAGMAPREAVEKCTADVKHALSRSKFEVKNYPDKQFTPDDFEKGIV